MNSSSLNILSSKKGQKINDCYGPIIIPMLTKFQFLVDDFGFNKPEIDMARHEVWINFKKQDFYFHVEYEMFNLPYGYFIYKSKGTDYKLSAYELAPLTHDEKAYKPPFQLEQVEYRLDLIADGIKKKLLELQTT